MFCINCGAQLPDGATECPVCGTPVRINGHAPSPAPEQGNQPDQGYRSEQRDQSQPGGNNGPEPQPQPEVNNGSQPQPEANYQKASSASRQSVTIDLGAAPKIVAIIFAVLYLISTIGSFGSVIANAFGFTAGIRAYSITAFIAAFVMLISTALVAGALVLFAVRGDEKNSDYFCLTFLAAAVVKIIASVIRMIFTYVSGSYGRLGIFGSPAFVCIRSVIYILITAGVLFAILYATGHMPFSGMTSEDIFSMIKGIPEFLTDEINGLSADSTSGREAPSGEKKKMKTNRNIIVFIILSCCTLGIYALYYGYKMAKDLNQVCAGDGEKTTGLFLRLIFSVCTCGLYEFYWQYAYAERMAKNADRFNVRIREGGMTILIWYVLGLLSCGLAQLVALFLQIKNLNALCKAYNLENFGEE